MLILSDGLRYRLLSEMRIAVCPIRGTVFVLIGQRFRLGRRRRHPHHIGGRRYAGTVPCKNPVGVGRTRLDQPVAEGSDMRPRPSNLRERTGRADAVGTLDAELESADLAFGPRQNHLTTSDGDRYQI